MLWLGVVNLLLIMYLVVGIYNEVLMFGLMLIGVEFVLCGFDMVNILCLLFEIWWLGFVIIWVSWWFELGVFLCVGVSWVVKFCLEWGFLVMLLVGFILIMLLL